MSAGGEHRAAGDEKSVHAMNAAIGINDAGPRIVRHARCSHPMAHVDEDAVFQVILCDPAFQHRSRQADFGNSSATKRPIAASARRDWSAIVQFTRALGTPSRSVTSLNVMRLSGSGGCSAMPSKTRPDSL